MLSVLAAVMVAASSPTADLGRLDCRAWLGDARAWAPVNSWVQRHWAEFAARDGTAARLKGVEPVTRTRDRCLASPAASVGEAVRSAQAAALRGG